jgi:hypothetical protein
VAYQDLEGGVIHENADATPTGFAERGSVDPLRPSLLLFAAAFTSDTAELVLRFASHRLAGVAEPSPVELARLLRLPSLEDLAGSGGSYPDPGLVELDPDFWGLRTFILRLPPLDGGW